MMINHTDEVTVEWFASEIVRRAERIAEDVISYGYAKGWLEDMDVTGREMPISRKSAARIVHQFMRFELKETELLDISPAGELQDLYDCRSCVMHVAQVYCKGIMDGLPFGEESLIFGMEETVWDDECAEILERLFCLGKRKTRVVKQQGKRVAEVITLQQVKEFLQQKDTLLIDVRPLYDFRENHMKGAMHITMNEILKNPYMVCEDRTRRLLLYCEEGSQSEVAAQCLINAGYEKICSFAWNGKEI
ncbi:MAG: rhodanese-like domain-containing protein [Lachnospiraceae bacterium]|nr:rhodanese-like domain-containing protein [Lachnospiraceae bacterium]